MNTIDCKITNNYDDITGDFINSVLNEYENVTDNLNYAFPAKIKKNLKSNINT